jgi:hypothetical protein
LATALRAQQQLLLVEQVNQQAGVGG